LTNRLGRRGRKKRQTRELIAGTARRLCLDLASGLGDLGAREP
jgi:hypothetical protein